MGKNNANSWLNAVKKAFRSPSNDHEKRSSRRREENEQEQEQENKRVKRRWIFRKNLPLETTIQHNVAICTDKSAQNLVKKQPKFDEVEIVKKETKAAVVIQTIFRGYLARRALLALKGVVKLQALIRGHNVRLRAKTTLKCIESLVRVQNRVCDQRRRLSFEATNSRKSISRNASSTPHTVDDHSFALEEIQSLVKKAKECSLKQDHKILAHALSHSHQIWRSNEDSFSDNINHDEFEGKHRYQSVRKDRNLCNQTDPIKILEIDTSTPYNHRSRYHHSYSNSPKTPSSSSNLRSIQAYYSCSPRLQKPETTLTLTPCSTNHLHRMSIGEKCCHVAKPNYMASTESAKARLRSSSTPRMSPRREQMGSAKKRLSFNDGQNEDDKMNDERMYRSIHEKTSCCTY